MSNTILQGLPDFGQSFTGENFLAFAPYQDKGAVCVAPLSLNIAQNNEGKPDFVLESVRSNNPFGGIEPHGILDMRLKISDLTAEMIEQIRSEWSEFPISVPHFHQGFIRFDVQANRLNNEMKELQTPISLEGLSISHVRLVRQMTPEALALLKTALQEDSLPIYSHAELEIRGVAPRIDAEISLTPSSLIRAVERMANRDRIMPLNKLVEYFSQETRNLPFSFIHKGEAFSNDKFGRIVTSWIVEHFATFVPAPENESEPHIRLYTASEAGINRLTWNLSQPKVVSKLLSFPFDAISEGQKLVHEFGIESFLEETIIESLNTGFIRVMLTHPFSETPKNILSMGVNIHLPYNPPYRPNAINETIEFKPGTDRAFINLRFTPFEKKEFFYQTFAVMQSSSGTKEILGEKTKATGTHLKVSIHDFPFDLLNISVSEGLIDQANIQGKITWQENERSQSSSFTLTKNSTAISLAVPQGGGAEASCTIQALDYTSSAKIETDFPLTTSLHLYRYSFAQYGPHDVDISVDLGQKALLALELLPEGKEENAEHTNILSFTPTQTQKTWTWFADSMFQPGFRYRIYSEEEGHAHSWSDVQSPFIQKLSIDSSGNSGEVIIPQSVPKVDGDFDFEGIRYYQSQHDKHTFYYIPLFPNPQSLNRKPSLSLIVFGDKGILQIGVELHASTELLNKIQQKIALTYSDLDPLLIRMRYAPLTIDKVDFVMHVNGEERLLATSKSSGIPPFGAVFNVNLNKTDTDSLISAIHGAREIVQVYYYASRKLTLVAEINLSGNIRTAKDDLDTFASLEACRDWVKDAITDEILVLKKSGSSLASSEMWKEAEEKALDNAAESVLAFIQSSTSISNQSNLLIEVTHKADVSLPFITITDIGDWLTAYNADDFIRTF